MISRQLLSSYFKRYEPEFWMYTVDTTKLDATNAKTSIPFNLYNVNDAKIKVEWGDDTTSTYTKTDYSSNTALNNTESTGLIHTYSEPGVYTVKVISDDFDKVKLYNSYYASTNAPIYYWRKTLTEVNNTFPTLNITNFENCFYQCSSLTSIPTDLFRYNTLVTNFENCFYQCSSLTSIPIDLFRYNTAVTSFYECFYGCSSLTLIPTGLFDNNTAVTNFSGIFGYCLALTSIPTDLFRYNTVVSYFDSCFDNCSSLISIPTDLFKYNTEVTSFGSCFQRCRSLTTIPEHLFDNNINVDSFCYCFNACYSLTSIPQDFFKYNTEVTDFSGCFNDCGITSIPQDLFKYNTEVLTFESCFGTCDISSMPQDLFKYNTKVTDFSGCFNSCINLKNFKLIIGSEIVSYFTRGYNFSNFVSDDANVTRTICVPANSTTYNTLTAFATASTGITVSTIELDCERKVLEYTINTEATTIGDVLGEVPLTAVDTTKTEKIMIDWGDGSAVEILPSQLASNKTHTYSTAGEYQITVGAEDWSNFLMDQNRNTTGTFKETLISIDYKLPPIANTTLNDTFYYCRKLETIHPHLFDNLPNVTSSNYCFSYCRLSSIPTDLFKYNTLIDEFSNCFEGCSSLTTIPSGLFDNNTLVTTFNQCFKGCSNLTTIPEHLFRYNTAVTSFNGCFNSCSSITSIPTDLFKYNTVVTNFGSCFDTCTLLTTIPADLFKYNTAVTSFSYCFRNCFSITSIPSGLFGNCTNVYNFVYCFNGCTSLNDFTIHIGSATVQLCASFVTNKAGTIRTVYVPTGSTTQTTFNSVASSLGLTIQAV